MRTGGICSYDSQKKSIRQDITTMPNYRFPINGIRHHDFKGRLDELYELAPGKRMSISVEKDNLGEENAIIVHWGKKFVGYVRSGKDRQLAYSLIMASGRGSMMGRIVDVDRENRYLWLEINTEQCVTTLCDDQPNILDNWSYDGEVLPISQEEARLHAMLCNLEIVTGDKEPWDYDMTEWLQYVTENMWRDMSSETSMQVENLLKSLTACSIKYPEYAEAAKKLQFAIDAMGSPEVRRLQAEQICRMADSKEMNLLLHHYGDRAKDAIMKLPDVLLALYLDDDEVFMGRLWYLHRPSIQVRAIFTLLAMTVRLKDQVREATSTSIPRAWLMKWRSRQKNKTVAGVVHDIICDYETEYKNPELALQLDEMKEQCNEPQTTIISQLNMQNGTQILPSVFEQKTKLLM